MAAINKERERQLIEAGEKALSESGFRLTRRRFKHYTIEKNGTRQSIVLRTSTDRWLGFVISEEGSWLTLGDGTIDGVVIAAYDDKKQPSKMIVYPVIARADLQARFDQARTAWRQGGYNTSDPRTWVCLDPQSSGKAWDAGSGIVEGLTPIARYPLHAQPATAQISPEPTPDPIAEADVECSRAPEPRGSISVVVNLDEQEQRQWAEYYGRKMAVDPRRLLVEVRLTFLT
jgi:hypothetical protein